MQFELKIVDNKLVIDLNQYFDSNSENQEVDEHGTSEA